MQLKGKLVFRNNQVYIKDEACVEVSLFSWLASYGLKDKDMKITVERIKEDERN
jgi:hypothetical protein